MVTGTRLFLHGIDPAAQTGTFVRTSAAALRAAAFLDGRTCYWEGAPTEHALSLSDAGGFAERIIFHVGFCGSTLLARLLDRPGQTLVLREPQSLTDIAAYRSALDREAVDDVGLPDLLKAVRRALYRPWLAAEQVVIKPSSWVNNLLPDLAAAPYARPLFLTMDRRSFVRAVLRGGSARLAFAARAAVHISNSSIVDAACVARALARRVDGTARLLTLAALFHDFQLKRFAAAAAAGGWPAAHWLTLEDIRADPAGALRAASRALDLAPTSSNAVLAEHAKQPGLAYSAESELDRDLAVEAEYGAIIDRTLAWIDGEGAS